MPWYTPMTSAAVTGLSLAGPLAPIALWNNSSAAHVLVADGSRVSVPSPYLSTTSRNCLAGGASAHHGNPLRPPIRLSPLIPSKALAVTELLADENAPV